jgi:uncharacterized protein with von Willebrand factor type A (vWA) domain
MDSRSLTCEVISFSTFLKDRGFKIFSSNVMDSLNSMEEIDISEREDFFHVLRTNLVTSDVEWELFEGLFEEYWQGMEKEEEEEESEIPQAQPECGEDAVAELLQEVQREQDESGEEDACRQEPTEQATYSPVARLERKNLAHFQKADVQIARLILKNMLSPFRLSVTRRFKGSKRLGDMDFRRVMKKSLRLGGMPLELFYKKKRKRLKRMVILVDVSGSMDRYARFVTPFIMGLKGVGSKAEVFVFSTSLTPITPFVRRFELEKALERISQEVPDWSGGTRIGYSLHQFNQGYAQRLLSKRTVVVILSDGWDLGGKEPLRREMEFLSQKAYCVIWLNPVAGDMEYKPICQGMETALPYVDYFLPADSLESLKKVGRTLSRVMAH